MTQDLISLARHIIVGLGGSATIDAGRGMLQALTGLESLRDIRFTIAADSAKRLGYDRSGAGRFFARGVHQPSRPHLGRGHEK